MTYDIKLSHVMAAPNTVYLLMLLWTTNLRSALHLGCVGLFMLAFVATITLVVGGLGLTYYKLQQGRPTLVIVCVHYKFLKDSILRFLTP